MKQFGTKATIVPAKLRGEGKVQRRNSPDPRRSVSQDNDLLGLPKASSKATPIS
jgi:hypothetical protein